jgi:hypothetical protein
MTCYNNLHLRLGLFCILALCAACKRDTATMQTNEANVRARLESSTLATTTPTCGSTASNHLITLAYAYQLVDNYRIASRLPGRVCQLYDQGGWVLAETFPASVIQSLLNQPGICSFRIYNGLDTDNRQHLVLVGVDQNGLDALSRNAVVTDNRGNETATSTTTAEIIVEMGLPCPRICPGVYTGR